MPNIAEIQPLTVESQYDKARKQAAWESENRPDFTDLGTAALLQGPVASAFNYVAQAPLLWGVDPKFEWNDKLFKELSDGVDPAYWPQLADAVSYQHASFIRAMAMNRSKYRDQLTAAGVEGTAASVVASLVDPAYLAVGAASGGLAYAAGGSKIAQLTRAGLLTGAAFAGVEQFKAAQDPRIIGTDVLLAGLAGGLAAGVGGATAGLSRTSRFAAGGAAAAAPGTVYAALSSEEETRTRDIMLNFLPQFFIGGTLASLYPSVREMTEKLNEVSRGTMKDQEFDIVKAQAESVGKKPSEVLTDAGKQHFSEQLARKVDDTFGDLQNLLKIQDQDVVAQPFINALDRLNALPDEKLLNRSEVDAVLEGTGYKAGNQGFPSVNEMRGYIDGMLGKRTSLTFADRQRLIAQHEYEAGVVKQIGEPTSSPPRPFSVGTATPEEIATVAGERKPIGPQSSAQFSARDFNLDGVGDDRTSMARFSVAGMAGRSEADAIAKFANLTGRDDLPKTENGETRPAVYGAREQARDWNNADDAQFLSVNKAEYNKYVDAEQAAGRKPLKYHDFMDEAGRAYRNPISTRNEFMDRIIENYRNIRKGNHDRAKLYGVPGAIATEHDRLLLDRITIRDRLDEATNQHTLAKLLEWAKEDIGAHPDNADLTPEQHLMLARDWLIGAGRQHNLIDNAEANLFRYDTDAAVAQHLRNTNPGITEEDIAAILNKTGEPPEAGKGNPPKFRRQIRMDTSRAHEYEPGKVFRFDDVIDNNLERIGLLNIKQLNGMSAMAEVYRQFSTPERPIQSLPEMMNLLAEKAAAQGIHSSAYETDLKRAEMLAKIVLGYPLNDNTLWNRSLRILRNFSFARVINPFTSIRNLSEISGSLGEIGMGTIMRQIPDLADAFVSARNGQLGSQAAKELYQAGISIGELHRRVMPGPEEGDLYARDIGWKGKADAALRAADRGTKRLANAVSTLSLMGPTQTVLDRVIGRLASQKLFDLAQSGRSLSAKRLAALGMDAPTWERIAAEIKGENGAHYEKTAFGNTWRGFNWDKWKDVEAAAKLRQAISKMSQRLVLRPDPSQMSLWMQNDTARTVMQFRHYITGAYESKTLFNASMHDRASFISFAAQLVAKSISYVLGTYLYAIGRDDREKYLRQRISPTMIAKAAVGQSEMLSLLPTGVDTIRQGLGLSPYFAFSRTTGLGQGEGISGLLTSSASLDTIDKTFKGLGIPARVAWQYLDHTFDHSQRVDPRMTAEKARALFQTTPLQNMLFWKQAIENQIKKLPRERK